MATYDASSVGSGDAAAVGTTLTISHTVANQSNRVLLVFVAINGPETVTGITYNSVALTKINPPGTISVGSIEGLEVWRLVAPSTGANNIVITLSGDFSGTRITGVGVSAYGVDQTNPIAAYASSTATNLPNPYSTSITTTSNNQLLVDLLARSTGSASPSGGQTQTQEQLSSNPLVVGSYKTAASSGSNSMSYSTNDVAADVLHIIVALSNRNDTTTTTETVTVSDSKLASPSQLVAQTVTASDMVSSSINHLNWKNEDKNSSSGWVNEDKS